YPFADRLYPRALGVLEGLGTWGPTVVLTDGGAVLQPRKGERCGIRVAGEGRPGPAAADPPGRVGRGRGPRPRGAPPGRGRRADRRPARSRSRDGGGRRMRRPVSTRRFTCAAGAGRTSGQ